MPPRIPLLSLALLTMACGVGQSRGIPPTPIAIAPAPEGVPARSALAPSPALTAGPGDDDEETEDDSGIAALPPGAPKKKAPPPEGTCKGVERWPIKMGMDAAAKDVALDPSPVPLTTLERMINDLEPPSSWKSSPRVGGIEDRVVEVRDVHLKMYKLVPDDHDIHLKLADGSGRTIVAEIPDPTCMKRGTWRTRVTNVRRAFEDEFDDVGPKKVELDRVVTVRGVQFFDKRNHGEGGSPNGIELHPVMAMCFKKGCKIP